MLPGSRKDRILARVGSGIVAVRLDGKVEPIGNLLSWSDYNDHDQAYSLDVSARDPDPYLTIRHLGSGTVEQLPVPWIYKAKPAHAAIGPNGRQVVIVSTDADVSVVDASAFAAQTAGKVGKSSLQ